MLYFPGGVIGHKHLHQSVRGHARRDRPHPHRLDFRRNMSPKEKPALVLAFLGSDRPRDNIGGLPYGGTGPSDGEGKVAAYGEHHHRFGGGAHHRHIGHCGIADLQLRHVGRRTAQMVLCRVKQGPRKGTGGVVSRDHKEDVPRAGRGANQGGIQLGGTGMVVGGWGAGEGTVFEVHHGHARGGRAQGDAAQEGRPSVTPLVEAGVEPALHSIVTRQP
mmetsp:Transcript_12670/g.20645  ORF Transcript_12670/g.20645 Transcript_12670/m.20645 type:complete len:218 (+) Transcript_12670:4201-4854(+)